MTTLCSTPFWRPRKRRGIGALSANFDELVKRSPTEGTFNAVASFPNAASSFCDERSRTEVEAFFAKRIENMVGGPRNLACAAIELRQ